MHRDLLKASMKRNSSIYFFTLSLFGRPKNSYSPKFQDVKTHSIFFQGQAPSISPPAFIPVLDLFIMSRQRQENGLCTSFCRREFCGHFQPKTIKRNVLTFLRQILASREKRKKEGGKRKVMTFLFMIYPHGFLALASFFIPCVYGFFQIKENLFMGIASFLFSSNLS